MKKKELGKYGDLCTFLNIVICLYLFNLHLYIIFKNKSIIHGYIII